jgi:hypothetical protein
MFENYAVSHPKTCFFIRWNANSDEVFLIGA